MNNWIPIDEFYKLNYTGYVWVCDDKGCVMLLEYDGVNFIEDPYISENTGEYYAEGLNVTKVIPIPEPKP